MNLKKKKKKKHNNNVILHATLSPTRSHPRASYGDAFEIASKSNTHGTH